MSLAIAKFRMAVIVGSLWILIIGDFGAFHSELRSVLVRRFWWRPSVPIMASTPKNAAKNETELLFLPFSNRRGRRWIFPPARLNSSRARKFPGIFPRLHPS